MFFYNKIFLGILKKNGKLIFLNLLNIIENYDNNFLKLQQFKKKKNLKSSFYLFLSALLLLLYYTFLDMNKVISNFSFFLFYFLFIL